MKNFIKTILLYLLLIIIMGIEIITTKLKKKKPDRDECVNCKKVFDKPQKCECGESRYIINQKKYKVEGNEILCGCSRDGELEFECHCDCEDGFMNEYRCSGCSSKLSIYHYVGNRTNMKINPKIDLISFEDIEIEKMPWHK